MEDTTAEDEVQFLYSTASLTNSVPFLCQYCSENLEKYTPDAKALHYQHHFDEESNASSNLSKKVSKSLSRVKQTVTRERFSEDFWFPSKSTPPPRNYTPSLISLIRKSLLKLHDKGQIQRAYLCFPGAVHISNELWDRGWGCGYRNFMMACASLIELNPMYFPLLDDPIPPGVRNLQTWLEIAWKDGFDMEGAKQLKHHLRGTSQWIGTAELYVAFSHRGIPSQLVDFDLSRHRNIDPLLQWIVEYFSGDSTKQSTVNDALRRATPVIITDKMPLILQHQGHSRTIIGFERRKDGHIDLLMFDPAPLPKQVREAALSSCSNHNATIINAASPSGAHNFTPSRLLSKVIPNYKAQVKKRKSSDTSAVSPAPKRTKESDAPSEVIIIDSEDEEPPLPPRELGSGNEPDPVAFLRPFRLTANTLKKHDKYQLLYFPLTEPLDEKDRLARRIVTSIKAA